MTNIWNENSLSTALDIVIDKKISAGIVQFNSLNVKEGDLFIAMPGENKDGHDFIQDALNKNAGAVIVSMDVKISDERIIKVTDTVLALNMLAEYKRKTSKAKFIAVTGSVGKTTTKEVLGMMLSSYGKTFISRGNFNNKLGMAINLASLSGDEDYAVIELGMSAHGELTELTKIVKPDVAIITNVAPMHLQFFNSVDDIADAKSEIFLGLDINSGVAVLNKDSESFSKCLQNATKIGIKNIKFFGTDTSCDIRLKNYQIIDDDKISITYSINNDNKQNDIYLSMQYIPEHVVHNISGCLVVIKSLGLDLEKAITASTSFELSVGRGRIVNILHNNKSYRIITDYYNSGPKSLGAALNSMASMKAKRKLMIIGDMRELGINTGIFHEAIADKIVGAGGSLVLLVGEIVQHIQKKLVSVESHIFPNSAELAKVVNEYIQDGDLILIKGSRGIKLEKVAQSLGVEYVF